MLTISFGLLAAATLSLGGMMAEFIIRDREEMVKPEPIPNDPALVEWEEDDWFWAFECEEVFTTDHIFWFAEVDNVDPDHVIEVESDEGVLFLVDREEIREQLMALEQLRVICDMQAKARRVICIPMPVDTQGLVRDLTETSEDPEVRKITVKTPLFHSYKGILSPRDPMSGLPGEVVPAK